MRIFIFSRFLFLAALLGCTEYTFAQKDWTEQKNKEGVKLWTKDLGKGELRQFKLETTLTSEMDKIYTCMRDVINMHTWYDRIEKVVLLKSISDNEATYLIEYSIPFPFENRVSTIKGSLDYDAAKGELKVQTEYYPYSIPDKYRSYSLVTTIKSNWVFTSISKQQVQVTHSGYMDPGGNIPVWLTNEGLTSGPFKTIKNFKKALKAY